MENLVETYQIVWLVYLFIRWIENTFHFPFVTFLIDILQDRTVYRLSVPVPPGLHPV